MHSVSPAEVSRSVDKLLPELLTKSGDTSARIHHMAVHTILTMADCNNVRLKLFISSLLVLCLPELFISENYI